MSVSSLFKRVKSAAKLFSLMGEEEVIHIFSHNDTDGLCSAAIVTYLCRKLQKQFHLRILKQLRPQIIKRIEREFTPKELMFVDFGSGQLKAIAKTFHSARRAIILDHHVPQTSNEVSSFKILNVNPHYFGFDGGKELSASGVAFLFAYTFSDLISVKKLLPLSILGALGDSQVNEKGKLTSLNRQILKIGEKENILQEKEEALQVAGKEYKPLFEALSATFQPILPGISGSPDAALDFLKEELGGKENIKKLTYSDLNEQERDQLTEGLLKRLLVASEEKNMDRVREKLFRVTYLYTQERSPRLRNLREFSALLNACGRLGEPNIGIRLAYGERGEILKKAVALREKSKEKISNLLKKATERGEKREELFVVDGRDWMQENFASVIASILCNIERNVKIIAVFSHSDEEFAKLSLRIPHGKEGENLERLINIVIEKIPKASGGGHKNAAGAYIPYSAIETFLDNLQTALEGSKW